MRSSSSILVLVINGLAVATIAMTFSCSLQGHRVAVADSSACMSPTILPGQKLRVRFFEVGRQNLNRYDIVMFHPPVAPAENWVMRVVGLPGEVIAVTNNWFSVNGAPPPRSGAPATLTLGPWLPDRLLQASSPRVWHLGQDEVLVVGDNLQVAFDGRYWGPVKLDAIVGTVSGNQ
jgi:signal peptidase I